MNLKSGSLSTFVAIMFLTCLEGIAGAAAFVVTNTSDSGPGSLRQAILDANATPGADTITFSIPGSGVHTIAPLSPLPALADDAGVTIDGYTQPGSSPNTLAVGDNAVLTIELSGVSAGAGAFGFTVRSSSNFLRGLVINRFGRGISIEGGSGSRVSGCFIGTDPSGAIAFPNRLGVGLSSPEPGVVFVTGTLVGGTDPGSRNIISGNSSALPGDYSAGVVVGFGAVDSVVAGNYIGTNAAGTLALPNGGGLVGDGVLVNVAADTMIGGTAAGSGNVISGNVSAGINVGFSLRTVIQGNLIGTNATGTAALPNRTGIVDGQDFSSAIGGGGSDAGNLISGNAANGILITYGTQQTAVSANLIGTDITGTAALGNGLNGISIRLVCTGNTVGGEAGLSNVIAYNGGAGVAIGSDAGDSSAGNRVSGNSIHDNGGLGIDLGSDGVTFNDPRDGDAGPNLLQNFPVLTSAVSRGRVLMVKGTLESVPRSSFAVEIFSNSTCDPSGFGEGEIPVGTVLVTTNANGKGVFNASFPAPAGLPGFVTATAADASGNTSEFSSCLAVSRTH